MVPFFYYHKRGFLIKTAFFTMHRNMLNSLLIFNDGLEEHSP